MKNFLRKIGSIFIPLIPGLVASGIINGVANFAKNAGADPNATWLQMLLLIGGGIFTFLGILVGWNTAKRVRWDTVLGSNCWYFNFQPGDGKRKIVW